jgi:hypothetical protein
MPTSESKKANHTKHRGHLALDTQLDKNLRAYEIAARATESPDLSLAVATAIATVGLGVCALPSTAFGEVVFRDSVRARYSRPPCI